MSDQVIDAAKVHVVRALQSNEKVLWMGAPDRALQYKKLKGFCLRNFVFALVFVGVIAGLVYAQPQRVDQIIAGVCGLALLRGIGALVVWPKLRKRHISAYAVTDTRLMHVDVRTGNIASWFSPHIDEMKEKKKGPVRTYKLADTEMGVRMAFEDIRDHLSFKALILPYTSDIRQDNSPTLPNLKKAA